MLDIFIPKRNPLWYPGSSLRAADGSPLPYTLDDIAGRPLDPREYASLLAEIKDFTKIGKGVRIGKGVKIGKGVSATFTPLDFAGAVAWFDVLDGASYTNAGGFITAITNKASSVSWTEGTSPPAYNATGLTGHPAMDFNGSTQRIISTEAAVWQAVAVGLPYTLMYIASWDNADRHDVVFGTGDSATNIAARKWGHSATGVGVAGVAATTQDNNSSVTVESALVADTLPHVNCFHASSSQISFQLDDGTANPSNAGYAPGTTTHNRSALGVLPRATPLQYLDGKLGELLLYDSRRLAADITTLYAYMSSRWA